MSYKDAQIALLDEGYADFRAIFRQLNDTQMSKIWLGHWCVRDIIAHVTGWHQEMGKALERIGR